MPKRQLVLSIDQGTTSTRCILFLLSPSRTSLQKLMSESEEVRLYTDGGDGELGWVSVDAAEVWTGVINCLNKLFDRLSQLDQSSRHLNKLEKGSGAHYKDSVDDGYEVVSVGITNQRETTLAWSRRTSQLLCKGMVWMDTRPSKIVEEFIGKFDELQVRQKTGLPFSTYFSGFKMRWLLDNDQEVIKASKETNNSTSSNNNSFSADNELMLGTMDTWLIYQMTGRQQFVTDVTNASRTSLLDISSLSHQSEKSEHEWSDELLGMFGVERGWLPRIQASASTFGTVNFSANTHDRYPEISETVRKYLEGVRITGVVGDQQASMVGHRCFTVGEGKCTYGTGCFLLFNVGPISNQDNSTPSDSSKEMPLSKSGLLTTVAYQMSPQSPVVYAIEGAISSAGSTLTWLRDSLGLIKSGEHATQLAAEVESEGTAGVVFVPALNGLLSPYWDPKARGMISGLSQSTKPGHICRALFEAVGHQVRQIVDAVDADTANTANTSDLSFTSTKRKLKVDGGMTKSDVMMQIQGDILGFEVDRASESEMTAYGAALTSLIGAQIFQLRDDGRLLARESGAEVERDGSTVFQGRWDDKKRNDKLQEWHDAVSKCRSPTVIK